MNSIFFLTTFSALVLLTVSCRTTPELLVNGNSSNIASFKIKKLEKTLDFDYDTVEFKVKKFKQPESEWKKLELQDDSYQFPYGKYHFSLTYKKSDLVIAASSMCKGEKPAYTLDKPSMRIEISICSFDGKFSTGSSSDVEIWLWLWLWLW